MIRAWRLVKASRAADAFSGEGAKLYGGRWNQPGTPLVYLAGSLALAALEVFVHLGRASRNLEFAAFPVEIPERLVEQWEVGDLPEDWRSNPAPAATMDMGTAWAHGSGKAVLRVPSVIVPQEYDFLLKPGHKDFRRIEVGYPEPFGFDPRMWK